MACFNSRARVGRDHSFQVRRVPRNCFNSRARVGRDTQFTVRLGQRLMFQFTRPRGARLTNPLPCT